MNSKCPPIRLGLTLLLMGLPLAAWPSVASGGLVIEVQFGGGLTASQQNLFSVAAQYWQSLIVDYIVGFNPLLIPGIDDADGRLEIAASGVSIDGVGGVLGSAGPLTGVGVGGYFYTASGQMQFDSADLAFMESNQSLLPVILHEMAHVLGFGTLWDPLTDYNIGGFQDVYTHATRAYTGANALAEWQTEFGQAAATFVPIEADGGPGTADAHWNEVAGGGGLTGITDPLGRDLRDELMTGWLNSPVFLSRMSVAQFADIGYVVDFSNLAAINANINNAAAIPEPGSMLLIGSCGIALIRFHRRRPVRRIRKAPVGPPRIRG